VSLTGHTNLTSTGRIYQMASQPQAISHTDPPELSPKENQGPHADQAPPGRALQGKGHLKR